MSRVRGKSCCSNGVILAINISVCLLIAIDFFFAGYNDVVNNGAYKIITFIWIPMVFIVTDAFVLLVAVFRVWRVLRNERMVFVNEKFMALHASLLFFVAVAIFLTYYDFIKNTDVNVYYWTSYLLID